MNSTPKMIRSALILFIVIVFSLSVSGSIYAYNWLSREAKKTNQTVLNNSVSKMGDSSLSQLQKELSELTPTISKINSLSAQADNFQTIARDDLTKYANITNLGELSFDFTASSSSIGQSRQFSVTLPETVQYASFIQFLQLIDRNVPKIYVESFTVFPARGNTKDSIIIKDLMLSILTR